MSQRLKSADRSRIVYLSFEAIIGIQEVLEPLKFAADVIILTNLTNPLMLPTAMCQQTSNTSMLLSHTFFTSTLFLCLSETQTGLSQPHNLVMVLLGSTGVLDPIASSKAFFSRHSGTGLPFAHPWGSYYQPGGLLRTNWMNNCELIYARAFGVLQRFSPVREDHQEFVDYVASA